MMSSAVLLAALVSTTAADTDARWTPFLGCWNLVEDETRQPFLSPEGELSGSEARPTGLVCLAPEGDGVRVRTFSDDEVFLEESLVADGRQQGVEEGNCRGWQRLDWSKDGGTLFTRSELTCEEGAPRSISGMSLMSGSSTWLEIQSVGSGDASVVVLRRYRPAPEEISLLRVPDLTAELLRESVRSRAAGFSMQMSVEDVIEASSRVEPEVVEAAIVESGDRFPLDGDTLVRLADASVSPRVIDLMVAMSFPQEFEVERETASPFGSAGLGYGVSPFYDPFWSSAYAYPYYFAPFGYYYWYAPSHPFYVVRPPSSSEGSVGRLLEGRGYTRITRTEPFDGGGGGRRARPRGESGGSWSGSPDGGSSSGGGTATSEGYTRGGSQSRTAKPKKQ